MRSADFGFREEKISDSAALIRLQSATRNPHSAMQKGPCYNPPSNFGLGCPAHCFKARVRPFREESKRMAEFICRLGTPAGEVVTRTVEAVGVAEARVRLEAEGFRVFSVTPPRTAGLGAITRGGKGGTRAREARRLPPLHQ